MSIVKAIVVLAILALIGAAVLQLTGVYNFTGQAPPSRSGTAAEKSDPYVAGETAFMSFHYDDAVMAYHKAIEEKPDSKELPTAMFRIARSYDELKKPAEAITAYKEFLTKFPNDRNAREAQKFLGLLGGNMDK